MDVSNGLVHLLILMKTEHQSVSGELLNLKMGSADAYPSTAAGVVNK